jgi:hypothetical protein
MAFPKEFKARRKGNTHEKTKGKKGKKNHRELKGHWMGRNRPGKIGEEQTIDHDKNGDGNGNGRSP